MEMAASHQEAAGAVAHSDLCQTTYQRGAEKVGLYISLAVIAVAMLWVIVTYNRLIILRNRVRNNWSQVDIMMKNRFDLIPNLVDTVSQYVAYEKGTLQKLTELRTRYADADSVQQKAETGSEMAGMLQRLIVVAESYPELKASQNFIYLKEQLSELEDKIRYARQFYNDTVEAFNTAIMMFPTNMLAGPFGFGQEAFFQIDEAERAVPTVKIQS